ATERDREPMLADLAAAIRILGLDPERTLVRGLRAIEQQLDARHHEQIAHLVELLAALSPRGLDGTAEPHDLAVEPGPERAPRERIGATRRIERGRQQLVDLDPIDAPAGRARDGDLALEVAEQHALGRILGRRPARTRDQKYQQRVPNHRPTVSQP